MSHKIQVNGQVRDMTPQEEAALEECRVRVEADNTANDAVIATRASAKTKLAALGLTDAEITALLGV